MSDQLHQFDVQLHQTAEVHTETFNLQAKDQADAKKQAEQLVKDKGITKDYKLVVIGEGSKDAPNSQPVPKNPIETQAEYDHIRQDGQDTHETSKGSEPIDEGAGR